MTTYTDAQLAELRAKRLGNLETRATALTSFQDEMTEQVHFAAAKFGKQTIAEYVAMIRGYCDALEDSVVPVPDTLDVPDKTERLNNCLAIAVLAFRCHYGE